MTDFNHCFFQRNSAAQALAVPTPSAKFSTDSRPAHACQPSPDLHSPAAVTSARATTSAALKSIATTGSAPRRARSVEKARLAQTFKTTELSANAPKATSDLLLENADLNATVMLTVPAPDLLVTTESARTLVTMLAESTRTATLED